MSNVISIVPKDELTSLELLRRQALTYYWLWLATKNSYYEVEAYRVGALYKNKKELQESETSTEVLSEVALSLYIII